MHVGARQRMECEIVLLIIQSALAAGYKIAIDNGEDDETVPMTDPATIAAAMMACDEEFMILRHAMSGRIIGRIHLVYGNSGHDVISDYTDTETMQAVLKSAQARADWWGDHDHQSNAQDIMKEAYLSLYGQQMA